MKRSHGESAPAKGEDAPLSQEIESPFERKLAIGYVANASMSAEIYKDFRYIDDEGWPESGVEA